MNVMRSLTTQISRSFHFKSGDSPFKEKHAEVERLASRMNLPPIKIYETANSGYSGFNRPWNTPSIKIPSNANKLTIAHDLAHIQQSHSLSQVKLLSAFIFAAAALSTTVAPQVCIPLLTLGGYKSLALLKHRQNLTADRIAADHLSSLELAEGIKKLDLIRKSRMDPLTFERKKNLAAAFYKREDVLPLKVTIQNASNAEMEDYPITPQLNKKIRKDVQRSTREFKMINLSHLVLLPHCSQVLEWGHGDAFPKFYRITQHNRLSDHEIIAIMQRILSQPPYLFAAFTCQREQIKENLKTFESDFQKKGLFIDDYKFFDQDNKLIVRLSSTL